VSIRQLLGDCRVTLPTLEPGSIQSVVTSPPYYGLRSYIADGDPLKPLEIGLEPTPELYVEHIVECFRHVRRALRDDGCLWLNLGDSYAGSGKGPSNSVQSEASQIGPSAVKKRNPAQFANGQAPTSWISTPAGLKPKDLMLMPFRVAMALQADGWTLRAHLPWLKRNCMPGSEKDRPTVSVESVFLFSKKRRYFWDYDAVKRAAAGSSAARAYLGKRPITPKAQGLVDGGMHGKTDSLQVYDREFRNWRTGDLFFDSWQGLLADEDGDPLAFVVNPQGFSGAHFATFPPKLVEPMVKASTRPGDTVLDPFSGAGTVGLVADRLGRNAVLCELSDGYGEMSTDRLIGDAPLFTEVAAG
jgi:DNA modification methylase